MTQLDTRPTARREVRELSDWQIMGPVLFFIIKPILWAGALGGWWIDYKNRRMP